jgi:hypothetical protein
LSEAKSVLASAPQSAAELNAQMQVIQAYLRLDPEPGIWSVATFGGQTQRVGGRRGRPRRRRLSLLKDGEWVMQSGNSLCNMIMSLNRMLASLGRVDFERARTLADQIGRPEMRVMMEIDLVQTTINGRPNANPMLFGGRMISNGVIIN